LTKILGVALALSSWYLAEDLRVGVQIQAPDTTFDPGLKQKFTKK